MQDIGKPPHNVFDEHGELTPEEQARREAFARAQMTQAGERTEDYVEPDYFGVDDTVNVMLPKSRTQYVTIKAFTEGDRRKYLDRTNRDVKLDKTGQAAMKMTPGSDRYELLKIAVVDWNLMRGGAPFKFGPRELDSFLEVTSPSTVDHIVKEVHKLNPWLLSEMSVEDIENEIANLEEMLEAKKKEEALQSQF
jgi:hypothetical protein